MAYTHGLPSSYIKYGCRCADCTKANRDRVRGQRERRFAAPKNPDDPRHGKPTFYSNYGCRCEACIDAWSLKCKEHYAKRKARKEAA